MTEKDKKRAMKMAQEKAKKQQKAAIKAAKSGSTPPAVPAQTTAPAPAAQPPAQTPPELMPRILLADDSPHAQRMGEQILSEEGFEVVTVSDGDSAFSAWRMWTPTWFWRTW